VTEINN